MLKGSRFMLVIVSSEVALKLNEMKIFQKSSRYEIYQFHVNKDIFILNISMKNTIIVAITVSTSVWQKDKSWRLAAAAKFSFLTNSTETRQDSSLQTSGISNVHTYFA